MAFSKILVANRGEIAWRIMRTAKAMGYRTVAVFSDADREAPHVAFADEAVRIGPPPVGESYLSIDRILEAARKSGADAIHPGYGFLSENDAFAAACEQAGLVFIGPPASAIAAMGNKAAAKRRMIDAGVPIATTNSSRRSARPAPRPRAPSDRASSFSRRPWSMPGTSRSRCLPMRTAMSSTSASETARCSGATRR